MAAQSTLFVSFGLLAGAFIAAVHLEFYRLRKLMSTQPTPLTFADLKSQINGLQNANTAQNNAIAAQIAEVKELITDYKEAVENDNDVDQAQLEQAIGQLRSVEELITQNTEQINQSAQAINDVQVKQPGEPVEPTDPNQPTPNV